jgi:hypothetical protein
MTEEDYKQDRRQALAELIGATRDSESAYWNALLTFNAILITVFSGISLMNNEHRVTIFALILCCLLSSFLLIVNFLARREHFLEAGKSFKEVETDPRKMESFHSLNLKVFRKIRTREQIAVLLLIPEMVLILWLVFP